MRKAELEQLLMLEKEKSRQLVAFMSALENTVERSSSSSFSSQAEKALLLNTMKLFVLDLAKELSTSSDSVL